MPRSRNIKPGFFENEHLGVLNSDARILFAALWTLADKQGVVECRIARIRTYAFRYNANITDEMIHRELTVLTQLDNGKMLSKVSYKDNEYLLIHNFIKHASPHHTEKRGDYPDFDLLKALINNEENKITVNSPLLHGENPPDSLILIPDSPTLNSETSKERKNFVLPLPDWLPLDDWKDYLDSRKKKATDRAKQLLIIKLFELKNRGNDPGEVLRQSTMNGWTSLIEIKTGNYNANLNTNFGEINGNFNQASGSSDKHQRVLEAAARGHARAQNPDF